MADGKRRIEKKIKELLANPPTFEGYHIQKISEELAEPWSTVRWYLAGMESRGEIQSVDIGRARLYSLKTRKTRKAGK